VGRRRLVPVSATGDHGDLSGLGDDDHPQYLNTTRHDTTARHGATVVDHGSIGGLGDDDHPQYLNDDRHKNALHHWVEIQLYM